MGAVLNPLHRSLVCIECTVGDLNDYGINVVSGRSGAVGEGEDAGRAWFRLKSDASTPPAMWKGVPIRIGGV